MNLIITLIVGGVAGWLASLIMKNDANQGTLFDIVLGIVGGFVGNFLLGMLGLSQDDGIISALVVSVIGACVLIAAGRMLRR
ncbi:MAG: GlsB/YeaQ/YmgE family stress response membrane protein [Pseudomonadales bacterium]|nr:GlsB/YeaQ/YmgE family stress response membrane protein [Candidatus Woesebacteria bacterium]MCB9801586.1 GlsB/YeaQ/YmgE family stress response membrane protein [Pseudomonadales bacterium]